MGFNIGKFLGKIAPLVGSAFGPVGAVLGAGIGAGFAGDSSSRAAAVGRVTQPGPISSPTSVSFRQSFAQAPGVSASSVGPLSLASLPRLAGAAGTAFGLSELFGFPNGGGNGSPTSRILAKARAATGGPVTRNKIIDAARACGLELAANTFGLDVTEVCQILIKGRTRRRRGVSAADIRRTKRTIHFASKIRKDLKALAK